METIGFIHVEAGTKRRSYETAAWYRTFTHSSQIVPLNLANGNVTYRLEGKDTFQHTPTLFAGVATGGGTMGPIDEPSTYVVQLYEFQVAQRVAMQSANIVLNEGWAVHQETRAHPVSCLGHRYIDGKSVPCEHEHHLDHRGKIRDTRNKRGFLGHGYVPGGYKTVLHHRFVNLQGSAT